MSVRPRRAAVVSFVVYASLSLVFRGGIPFVRFPAFSFPVLQPPAAVPLFLANGAPASVEDFVDFDGLDGADVDVAHPGLSSAMEHRFYEDRHWLDGHQGDGGDTPVALGTRVLTFDEAGRIVAEDRIVATGTARQVE